MPYKDGNSNENGFWNIFVSLETFNCLVHFYLYILLIYFSLLLIVFFMFCLFVFYVNLSHKKNYFMKSVTCMNFMFQWNKKTQDLSRHFVILFSTPVEILFSTNHILYPVLSLPCGMYSKIT